MTTQNITLFKALGAKMDFLSQRQTLISQNVANSDTPHYRPQDLMPVDFSKVLHNVVQSNSVSLATTNAAHMPPKNEVPDARTAEQKDPYEVTPMGNAVVMEEQLINARQTVMDYNLMTNLYQKNIGLLRTAIGRQG